MTSLEYPTLPAFLLRSLTDAQRATAWESHLRTNPVDMTPASTEQLAVFKQFAQPTKVEDPASAALRATLESGDRRPAMLAASAGSATGKAPKASTTTSATASPIEAGSWQADLRDMLSQAGGAKITAVMTKFDWQQHTAQARISNLRHKNGLAIVKTSINGELAYKIEA